MTEIAQELWGSCHTPLHEMKRRNAKRGMAMLCIGGGMGIAIG
jgi:acetyl-CoA acetyltransferase